MRIEARREVHSFLIDFDFEFSGFFHNFSKCKFSENSVITETNFKHSWFHVFVCFFSLTFFLTAFYLSDDFD